MKVARFWVFWQQTSMQPHGYKIWYYNHDNTQVSHYYSNNEGITLAYVFAVNKMFDSLYYRKTTETYTTADWVL
jgi:hypothetical protein